MPLLDDDGGCVRHDPDEILAWWNSMEPDQIILRLERVRLGWSIDHTGNLIECRIWAWPHVIGRYRPKKVLPLADMLRGAIASIPEDDNRPNAKADLAPASGAQVQRLVGRQSEDA
jgi:hypothetical protein